MSIKTLLNEEIESELKELGRIEVGSEQYEKTVNGISKLSDKLIELKKIDNESADKVEAREIEIELRQQEFAAEQKDRRVKNLIAIGSIVLPVVTCVWGTKKSFEFEKDGSITTIMGRGFIQKLLPNKK